LSLFTQKGAILAGSYADIVVWDPKLPKMISAASQKSIID
jgi:dihydropyrimidinase